MKVFARDLTERFVQLRSAAGPVPANRYDVDAGQVRLLASFSGPVSPPAPSDAAGPGDAGAEWLSMADGCRFDLGEIKSKLALLRKFQRKRLLSLFDEEKQATGTAKVEETSRQIAEMLRKCEAHANEIVACNPPGGARHVAAEHALRQNTRKAILSQLQALTKQFRVLQNEYVAELMKQGGGADGARLPAAFAAADQDQDSAGPSLDRRMQTSMMEGGASSLRSTFREENMSREAEISQIAQTMGELSTLFRELDTTVMEQGTVLDRVDYNLERIEDVSRNALRQIRKAHESIRSGRATRVIYFLAAIDGLLFVALVLKWSI